METHQNTLTLFERLNLWIQDSIMIKLLSIGFLIIILLIPTAWINEVIYERQQRADEVVDEVADKWSGSQTISGPFLVIPYKKQEVIDLGKEGKRTREYEEKAFFLPQQLAVDGDIKPQTLHRGIFDVVVYESTLDIRSVFTKPDFRSLSIEDNMVLWSKAYVVYGITDLRGIQDSLTFVAGKTALEPEPSNNIGVSVASTITNEDRERVRIVEPDRVSDNGIMAKLPWNSEQDFAKNVNLTFSLKGSKRLHFIPAGKITTVSLTGSWSDPSFDGEFLPDTREITADRFNATWKILHFNRPFAQQWTESNQVLSEANFGVNLLIPVDQYQKSTRTAKYGILIILLTFMALFLVEITQQVRIHPFQYILIGAALIIYYTLLLSMSEHVGYNVAYLISSVATIALVGSYSRSFFPELRLALLFSALLGIFYAFIYIIILQQDFSLLIGSIGLFVIIGTLMYFSRKVKWYRETAGTQAT